MPGGRPREFQALGNPRPAAGVSVAPPSQDMTKTADITQALLQEAARRNGHKGWRVIIFHLSKLQKAHRRGKHLQITGNMLQDIVRRHQGRLFPLPSRDLAIVCKDIPAETIEDTVETLQYLFNDDPFAQQSVTDYGFHSNFDLEWEYPQFLVAFRKRPLLAPLGEAPLHAPPPWDSAQASSVLDLERVAGLLSAVGKLDLSPMLRRQMAWKMIVGQEPQPHSEELFISIKALREAAGQAFEVASDRQLFGYLTRWLDAFMLKSISWEHFSVGSPLSFNINLETLRGPEFAAFEKRRPPAWRDRIMLELQLADLWGDFTGFSELNKGLKQTGYLRCLDGVAFSALRFLNLRQLDVDYVKLIWDDTLLTLGDAALRELCNAIAECGRERIILTRCGREEAVRVGRILGIQIFQGWAIKGAGPHA